MKKLTPLSSIRLKCIEDCCCGLPEEVRLCPVVLCPLYSFRMKKGHGGLLKTIKMKCLSCGDGTFNTIRDCKFENCPLYAYRMGKKPKKV